MVVSKVCAGRVSFLNITLTERRALFLVIAATLFVYANSLSGEFIFDDTMQVVGNPQLRSWKNFFHFFVSDVWSFQRIITPAQQFAPYYRPLFLVYLLVGYQVFGLWASGWHLMSIGVHTGATVAVYYLIRRLSGRWKTAALAALIFGIHPTHVESVAWISGIPDPLAVLFYVPAFFYYLRYRERGNKSWFAASLFAYSLALLCKEATITLPAVIVVWEIVRGERMKLKARLRHLSYAISPYALIGLAYLSVRFAVMGKVSWVNPGMTKADDLSLLMTVPSVVLFYIKNLLAPFYLSIVYYPPLANGVTDLLFLLPTLLLVGIGVMLCVYRHRISPDVWIGLALLITPLLPVLYIKVFHQAYIVQDRYLYLPSVGFCFLVALFITCLARRRSLIAAALTGMIIVSFGISTMMQNRVWHDSVALWQRAVEYAPDFWAVHFNLGQAYLEHGNSEAARTEFLTAVQKDSTIPTVYSNLSYAQRNLGDNHSAIESLREAIAINPDFMDARRDLGRLLFDSGDLEGAHEQFSIILMIKPMHPARYELDRATVAIHRRAESSAEVK